MTFLNNTTNLKNLYCSTTNTFILLCWMVLTIFILCDSGRLLQRGIHSKFVFIGRTLTVGVVIKRVNERPEAVLSGSQLLYTEMQWLWEPSLVNISDIFKQIFQRLPPSQSCFDNAGPSAFETAHCGIVIASPYWQNYRTKADESEKETSKEGECVVSQ